MKLILEPYLSQVMRWPKTGRHILAQFDDTSVVVYQAYRSAIGTFAAQNGYFGGDFNFKRMSWIKTSFLWMMYRSGWGQKSDQEVILAIWIKREAFDHILANSVHSTFIPEIYLNQETWKKDVENSSIRLQWDPDHDPTGAKVERRAIQLGLRQEALAQYAKEWIIHIEDISHLVQTQQKVVKSQEYQHRVTPQEKMYVVSNSVVTKKIALS